MHHSKSVLLLAFGAVAGALLSGCAQINDQLSTIGKTTPENAPPGYHLFNDANAAAQRKDYAKACENFCDAAEVGHPQAKQKCIDYAYLAATHIEIGGLRYVCNASQFDKKADNFCSRYNKSLFNSASKREQLLRELRSDIQKEIDRKQVKKQIQQGGFGEFTAEEF